MILGANSDEISSRRTVVIMFQAGVLSLREIIFHYNHRDDYIAKPADMQYPLWILEYLGLAAGASPRPTITNRQTEI